MKKIITTFLIIQASLNSISQSQLEINLATGVNNITIDSLNYITVPLKIELEYLVIPKFSTSFYLNLERSLNKDNLNKRTKITEVSLNINYGIIGDMDLGSSLIANLGFGFFSDSRNISSNFLRYGITAQKEFNENKILFINGNYYTLFGEPSNREGYYQNKFGLNVGVKFIITSSH